MKTINGKITGSYFALVKEYPLVPIKTERQYDAAVGFLEKLAIRDEGSLDGGEQAYLEALTQFVGDYEDKHFRVEIEGMEPLDALKFLLHENGMKAIDLGKLLGNRSLASQILSGKRGLSKTHIRLLSERFKVEPGLFIEKVSARAVEKKAG